MSFAALDSETAAALRERHPGLIPEHPDTVVLIAEGRVLLRSRAFFHVARHLRAPWRWLAVFRYLPAMLTDLPYRLVARLRHRLWGRADACTLPGPAQRERFLP
jgi:predicted DCC family thiol-disulfide oxidoreductase YuxK